MRTYVVLLLFAAGAAWGLREVSRIAEVRITTWRDEYIGNLLHSAGYRLAYEDVSFSLGGVDFRDLAIGFNEPAADPLVVVGRVRLRYSLVQLVRNRDPLAALQEIRIADADLAFELGHDHGLHHLLGVLVGAAGGGGGASDSATLPAVAIAGDNLGVVIATEYARVALQELEFQVHPGEPLSISANCRWQT